MQQLQIHVFERRLFAFDCLDASAGLDQRPHDLRRRECPLGERQPACRRRAHRAPPLHATCRANGSACLAHTNAQAWREQSLPERGGCADGDEARSEDGDTIGHALDLVEVVRAEQHGASFAAHARR